MGKIVLNYVGNDSWCRPVYESNGKLFVDVAPLSYCEPDICTKASNDFDGEPDVSIRKDIEVDFQPKRIVWR